ncbi:MAG TPA: cupredoxin domain-containing protein [Hanamia sp.]|nr:cupredoxin domain-containing protein [Hanamia sp.]
MKLKHFFSVVIMSLVILTFFSCSKSKNDNPQQPPAGNGDGSSITINIYNMAFPASTSVKKGTIVKWFNQDAVAHTVTSDDGTSFSSGNMNANATFSYTANTVGTFNYHCNYHSNMTATLVVTQ